MQSRESIRILTTTYEGHFLLAAVATGAYSQARNARHVCRIMVHVAEEYHIEVDQTLIMI